ncbi:TPA: hypothetical protein QDB15_002628 [Burkholderia vietnamiensis]|uniref:phage/plasmid replication protein, II/X family n=1 Tax=Burkholderia vietnamiensis TaxID=60552 RepID=UPI0009BE57C5|nr:phage/plasmid replication protein, II/X family [Burkholderia vietnamiensis]MCA8207192.1 phage/plasmid replication protein, II/X family [Burkholderia vietnamiensis]HDR9097062.1 hypothetical protein [Burkholderia vietnamiensis]HDR9118844.1 hypothetical protein [Burkholderia vietnamiensis]HDR9123260.1 hypothetical protein [Burkholderia vietnamiensis]HDR9170453.1 hypothetical protein [Burkholderia vietnamiensis]
MMEHPILKSLDGKFRINVDTVEFSVSGVKINVEEINQMMVLKPGGEMASLITNRKAIRGRFKRHPLQIRYRETRGGISEPGMLFVEGSVFGFKYGQNVFTSSNLRAGCLYALRCISRKVELNASPETWSKWKAGEILLDRVDLAVNFDLGSDSVSTVVDRIAHQLIGKGTASRHHTGSVCLAPRDSKEYSVAMYAKGAEMKLARRKATSDQNYDRLVGECENLLRVEVRLRKRELKRCGLSRVSDWTIEKARDVFREYASKFPMLDVVAAGPVGRKELNRLPPKLRDVFALHKMGADLTVIYPPRTLATYRRKFAEIGIDIKCQSIDNPPRNPALSFGPVKTPRWLIDAGMAPRRKRNRGANVSS